MCHPVETAGPRASDVRAAIGAALWIGALIGIGPDWTTAFFLLAPLVLVPLGLELIDAPERPLAARIWRWALLVQPWAAALLVIAYALPQGPRAAVFAVPWFMVTALLASVGMSRFAARRTLHPAQLAVDAALIFVIVGGAFTVITRLGLRPLGFEPIIIALTAVHFHYAGFILPLLAGLATREAPGRTTTVAVASAVVGVPLLAAGMTVSPTIEIIAVALVVLGSLLVAAHHVRRAAGARSPTAMFLLGVSGVAMIGGMLLAAVFAWGRFVGVTWIDIPTVLPTHGSLNALGFALCGLLARRLYGPSAALRCR
jgi:hypothetical protein